MASWLSLIHAHCVPAGWVGDPPPAGTEVFIGKLPQDMYENILIPLFQSVGTLYEFRLMMTFSGLNRGFAYAKYSTQRAARKAIATFNNFSVREGCAIVVCRSTEKCELSMDGLAGTVSRRELEAVLRRITAGILSVTLHPSPGQQRTQLALLKFSSHHAAAMAKKTLMEGTWEAGGMLGVLFLVSLRADSTSGLSREVKTFLVLFLCPMGGQLSSLGRWGGGTAGGLQLPAQSNSITSTSLGHPEL